MHLRRPDQPRLHPVEKVAERARARGEGRGANLNGTMAHNNKMRAALGAYSQVLFDPELVEPRLRELAILRMAWNTQCIYEFGQHRLIGGAAGLTDFDIEWTTRPLRQGDWKPVERVVLQMADDLYCDDCVTDLTWTELCEHFSGEQIIALLAVPLSYRLYAGLMNSVGLQLDEGVPGWPAPASAPEGVV
jgi:4-carboxymuconolactone decarboxylase